jgi:hypothetical protein
MRRFVRISLVLILCSTVGVAQSRSHRSKEQHDFGLGADRPVVTHPVLLTEAELAALADDKLMQRELDQVPPIPKDTREGLEAAVVHLHGPQERDLVVMGSGRPYMGANVGPFWVIRDLPTGPQVVLSTIALVLTVQETSFKGLRNIGAFAATAVTGTTINFRFNGTKYVEYKEKARQLGK